MSKKLTYNPEKPTIGSQIGNPKTSNEPASSVFSRMSGRPAPAADKPTNTTSAPSDNKVSPAAVTTPASSRPVTNTPKTTTPVAATPKPAAVPAPKPAAPAAAPAPAPGSFKAAYAKAREMGGSKAQFEYGGKKFQAAATKAEYVPMSQQKKVDIGSSTTGSTATANVPTPPRRPNIGPEAPAAAPKPSDTPSSMTGAQGGNPTPSGGSIAPDAGRQSTPTNSGNSISVAPEKSSATPPEEKKKAPVSPPTTTVTESFVNVGGNKYRII